MAARAIWSGSINFGLVTIPVKLMTAVRGNELSFNQLHDKDEGRIKYTRTCAECGEDVPWEHIVKGYEFEKGQYVLISDEDLKSVAVEATQSVDIQEFVELSDINPMYFDKPYYLEPDKKGRHAYALLRDALEESGKVGVAKVVLRQREHLAALKPNGDALVLELMHWADELVEESSLDLPARGEKPKANEMKAAMMLIDAMAGKFDPEQFHDTYKEQVLAMIEARAAGQAAPKSKAKARPATNVVNILDVLERSLSDAKKKDGGAKGGSKRGKSTAA